MALGDNDLYAHRKHWPIWSEGRKTPPDDDEQRCDDNNDLDADDENQREGR